MLTFVRWYVAYPLSLRHVQEMIVKSVVFSSITSRFIAGQSKFLPVMTAVFRRCKRPVRTQLEDGRDLHQSGRSVEGPIPCS